MDKWHWYCNIGEHEMGVVQREDVFDRRVGRSAGPVKLPMGILRLAHEEYSAQGHVQSLKRIQERGGFGVLEVIYLLADHVNRLKEVIGD